MPELAEMQVAVFAATTFLGGIVVLSLLLWHRRSLARGLTGFSLVPALWPGSYAVGASLLILSFVGLAAKQYIFLIGGTAAAIAGYTLAGWSPAQTLRLGAISPLKVTVLPILSYLALLPLLVSSNILSIWLHALVGLDFEHQSILLDFSRLTDTREIAQFVVLAVVAAPLSEEIFFRAYLYPLAKSKCGARAAALAVSALFAAVHFHSPVFLPLFVLGMALILIYEATGSLWPSIALHATVNAVTLTVAKVYPELLQ